MKLSTIRDLALTAAAIALIAWCIVGMLPVGA